MKHVVAKAKRGTASVAPAVVKKPAGAPKAERASLGKGLEPATSLSAPEGTSGGVGVREERDPVGVRPLAAGRGNPPPLPAPIATFVF